MSKPKKTSSEPTQLYLVTGQTVDHFVLKSEDLQTSLAFLDLHCQDLDSEPSLDGVNLVDVSALDDDDGSLSVWKLTGPFKIKAEHKVELVTKSSTHS